jgi:hypothetical protein
VLAHDHCNACALGFFVSAALAHLAFGTILGNPSGITSSTDKHHRVSSSPLTTLLAAYALISVPFKPSLAAEASQGIQFRFADPFDPSAADTIPSIDALIDGSNR